MIISIYCPSLHIVHPYIVYISHWQAVILALDAGANYQGAGPLNLAGQIDSFRTALPKDIKTFEKFQVSPRMWM